MNKWHKTEDEGFPEIGKKALFDTNHGKYVGIYKGEDTVTFLEPIHFNGSITVPSIVINKWRYVSDKEYNELKGFEIVE